MIRPIPIRELMGGNDRRRVFRPVWPRLADELALRTILRDEVIEPWRQGVIAVIAGYEQPGSPVTDRALMTDADGRELQWLIDQIDREVNARAVYQTGKLGTWVTGVASRHTRVSIDATRSATGVDVTGYMLLGDIRPQLEEAIARNVGLISRLSGDTKARVEQIIFDGLARRKSRTQVAAEIRAAMGITWRRARLIARDQTAKLNATLTRIRNEQLGIKSYVWHTELDERVRGNPDGLYPKARPSHWWREGRVFFWSRPPSDGHPGEPINCRCVATAILEPDPAHPRRSPFPSRRPGARPRRRAA